MGNKWFHLRRKKQVLLEYYDGFLGTWSYSTCYLLWDLTIKHTFTLLLVNSLVGNVS